MPRDATIHVHSNGPPVAALRLYEQNRLRITAPVASYLPELANLRVARRAAGGNPSRIDTVATSRQPTVDDLMTHRAGFTYFFFPKSALRDVTVGTWA
ncbi:MAG TPA: serine hydrolase [Burkholderiaceae bacterium]